MKKDVEMHNLAKSYLAEIIKEECWNSMVVKGRSLKVTELQVQLLAWKEFSVESL